MSTSSQTVALTKSTPNSRVVLLDYYRFVAVTLALVSHVLVRLKLYEGSIGPIHVATKVITRMALPSLLILFGVMIAMVYDREDRPGKDSASVRIITRLVLCYLAFVALATMSVVGDDISLRTFAFAAVLAVPVMYANIFKFYFFMLIAAMPLLRLRTRAGIWAPAIVSLACFVGASVADGHDPWKSSILNGYASALYGLGRDWGPSIFHSLVLVAFGMSYGTIFRRRERRFGDTWVVSAMLVIAGGILVAECLRVGLPRFAEGIADIETYRLVNHPVYFAYGIWGAVIMTIAGGAVFAVTPATLRPLVELTGQNTFVYFFIGNVFVLLIPPMRLSHPVTAMAVLAVVLLAMGWVWLWGTHLRNAAIARAFFGAVRNLAVRVSAVPGCRSIFCPARDQPPA